MKEPELFGPAAACRNLQELIALASTVIGADAQQACAAYGMLLGARSALVGGYFEHALGVLNGMGIAKMELDKAQCHTLPTVIVTAEILSETQRFLDEVTIPCTEWPSSTDVVDHVAEIARSFACPGPWRRTILNAQGVVIGTETFDVL